MEKGQLLVWWKIQVGLKSFLKRWVLNIVWHNIRSTVEKLERPVLLPLCVWRLHQVLQRFSGTAGTQTRSQLLPSVGSSMNPVDPSILGGLKADVMSSSSLQPRPKLCVWSSTGSRCQNCRGDRERKRGVIRQKEKQAEECLWSLLGGKDLHLDEVWH